MHSFDGISELMVIIVEADMDDNDLRLVELDAIGDDLAAINHAGVDRGGLENTTMEIGDGVVE